MKYSVSVKCADRHDPELYYAEALTLTNQESNNMILSCTEVLKYHLCDVAEKKCLLINMSELYYAVIIRIIMLVDKNNPEYFTPVIIIIVIVN
jgi:hypothetical protein